MDKGDNRPPLEIVLGRVSRYSPTKSIDNVELGKEFVHEKSLHILGTSSYLTTQRLSTGSGHRNPTLKLNKDGRVPMEDRKGPLDHFRPKALALSTIRVTAITTSTTLSTYFTDQLHSEQRVESLVDEGKITPRQADELNEEWERNEWQRRIGSLPKKIGWAVLRFHACTGLMRFYEFFVGRYVLRVDVGPSIEGKSSSPLNSSPSIDSNATSILTHDQAVTVMDNLTRDPFQASLRTSQILNKQEHSPGKVLASDGTESSTSRELVKRMFPTCVWANIIPFFAELTVQQGILLYGYVMYYIEKKKRIMERQKKLKDLNPDAHDLELVEEKETDQHGHGAKASVVLNDIDKPAYVLSFVFRSSRLTIARSMSWIAASAGGAVGSAIYPGWGTVFGIQIGDNMVGALID